jgi:hypothetical protein
MAGITLSIIPDKSDTLYRVGETIKGQVRVVVTEEIRTGALLLVLCCKGFSAWKRETATVERKKAENDLFKGSWVPGEFSYPFEIVVPSGPFTYKGQVFDVTWHLGAKAGCSEGEDVTAGIEITILPEKNMSGAHRKRSPEVVYKESARNLKGFFVFSLLLFLTGAIVSWRTSPLAGKEVTGIFLFGGMIPMLLGLAILFFTTWQGLVNKRIKKVEVRIGSRQAIPGEKIHCSVTFQSNISFEVDRISLVLRGEEIVDFRNPSRKNSKFRSRLLHEIRQELPLGVKQIPVNVPVQAQGEVMVPLGIPYSIDLMDSDEGMALKWQLEFNIEMKHWPDWMHTETITIQP